MHNRTCSIFLLLLATAICLMILHTLHLLSFAKMNKTSQFVHKMTLFVYFVIWYAYIPIFSFSVSISRFFISCTTLITILLHPHCLGYVTSTIILLITTVLTTQRHLNNFTSRKFLLLVLFHAGDALKALNLSFLYPFCSCIFTRKMYLEYSAIYLIHAK